MGDDPPYLVVGTEVSAKYKGAFCEAKIRKIVRLVKCKVNFKGPGLGAALLSDDLIKGPLRVGAVVEAKHPTQSLFVEATINKIQDCSQYTVVFDDGDITTLRRSALCLKSGRHFNESETLDQLPLTHPEHFSNPVVGGRRGVVAKRLQGGQMSSDEEDVPLKKKKKKHDDGGIDIGKVVGVENTEKKKTKESWFPGLIVSPLAQESAKIRSKEEYLIRSFRDGRYYTVPKKETAFLTKDTIHKYESNPSAVKAALDKALSYIEKNELPVHWDREEMFLSNIASHTNEAEEAYNSGSETSEDDTNDEEKNRFVAELYKFMDERGTPINKVPVVCNKDLDLYKLYKIVNGKGGYSKVTNSSLWKPVTQKMGFGTMPSTSTINLIKQAYKRFIHNYEESYKKISGPGSTAAILPRARQSRSILKGTLAKDIKVVDKGDEEKPSTKTSSTKRVPTPPVSDEEAKLPDTFEEGRRSRNRQDSRLKAKEKKEFGESDNKDQVEQVSIKKRRIAKEKELSEPSQITEQPASKNIRNKGKRTAKEDVEAEEQKVATEIQVPADQVRAHIDSNVKVSLGDRLRVYYGPKLDGKVTYEAKVIENDEEKQLYLVHYTGWNTRYDEWISIVRIAENLSLAQNPITPLPQGRGPSTHDMELETSSELLQKGSPKVSGRKRNRLPTLLSPGNTRSKSVISESGGKSLPFSTEAEFSKKRSTRKLDVGQPLPSEKETKRDETQIEEKQQVQENTETQTSKPAKSSKDKQMNILDLNQIRAEMKGLDKIVNTDSTNSGRLDVYEFQEELSDSPKYKVLGPRSPNRKEEDSKDTECDLNVVFHSSDNQLPAGMVEIEKSQLVEEHRNATEGLELQVASPIVMLNEPEASKSPRKRMNKTPKEDSARQSRTKVSPKLKKPLKVASVPLTVQPTLDTEAVPCNPKETNEEAASKIQSEEISEARVSEVATKAFESPTADGGKDMRSEQSTEIIGNNTSSCVGRQKFEQPVAVLKLFDVLTKEEPQALTITPQTTVHGIVIQTGRTGPSKQKTLKSVNESKRRAKPGSGLEDLKTKIKRAPRKGSPKVIALKAIEQVSLSSKFPQVLLTSGDVPLLLENNETKQDKDITNSLDDLGKQHFGKEAEKLGIKESVAISDKGQELCGAWSSETKDMDFAGNEPASENDNLLFESQNYSRAVPKIELTIVESAETQSETSAIVGDTNDEEEKVLSDQLPCDSGDPKQILTEQKPTKTSKFEEKTLTSESCSDEISGTSNSHTGIVDNEIPRISPAELNNTDLKPLSPKDQDPCNSLFCEEEIPGSPTPEMEEQKLAAIDHEIQEQACHSRSSSRENSVGEQISLELPKDERQNEAESSIQNQDFPIAVIDNTPPATPESSSLSSTDSDGGGDIEDQISPVGPKSKGSDTDSLDDELKMYNIISNEDGSNSELGRRFKETNLRFASNEKNSPRRRRILRRRSPDEDDEMYCYRYRREPSRLHDSCHDEDDDAPQVPFSLPPMTTPKPPRVGKYYFIPEIDPSSDQRQRICILTANMQELKEKYSAIKSQLNSIERKRKKIRKREKESSSVCEIEEASDVTQPQEILSNET